MAIFGLGTKAAIPVQEEAEKTSQKQTKPTPATSQSDEAKALLAKMAAKKDAGDCPFC